MEEEKVNEFKSQANDLFQKMKYEEAIELYTKAIEIKPNAILYSNRSICLMKLEKFMQGLEDANKSIELDPKYPKGYYRKGSALFELMKFEEAIEAFKQVVLLAPNNKLAREKYQLCQKEIKRILFEKAISRELEKSPFETLTFNKNDIPNDYDGFILPENNILTFEIVKEMIESFKNEKIIHSYYAFEILKQIREILSKLPNVLELSVSENQLLTVCGDIHGQFYDLLNIFEINGYPTENHFYLFNGDMVDRGSFSLEVILTLFSLKIVFPQSVHLHRGNHESSNMNSIFGFFNEVRTKLDFKFVGLFTELFDLLPLSSIVENKIFIVHGGLPSKEDFKIEELKKIDRKQQPDTGIMCDLLWSDPGYAIGIRPSPRGLGVVFGADRTQKFLENNDLQLIIRSHEVKMGGYEVTHNDKLITVFSAPNYGDNMNNFGSYINFRSDLKVDIKQFQAVPHPKTRTYYANMM
ncbi:serine/threonine-protein phosphatase 5 [Anaeramoeba ignava]|uniref:protein-serine/threonine phosphatase n=1 Tax=Anaeramoeba ignava TaxID=1746090 RepID=A0A9Q0LQG0_ANAIG|nr:serine/threonine-protein phosphatase 5 [Anaeramoeba ignava]